jgi:phosphatidylglycerol:prolipoprotein diacylglycerol transferase
MVPSIHIGSLVLWSYGLMMGVGMSLGYLFGEVDFRRRGVPIPMGIFLPAMLVSGLIGAKLDHALVVQWHTLRQNPLAFDWVATFWGGYTWFGGVIGGILTASLLARLYKTPVLKVLDVAPVLSLALACGRIGCFLAGDGDYGVPTSLPWGMTFPHGIVPTRVPVHPTPLYEIAYALILFAVLWQRGKPEIYARTWQGSQLALYLFWTGLCRFFVEFLSRNAKVFAGLTEAQLVGVFFIVTAAILAWFHSKTGEVYASHSGACVASIAARFEGGTLPEAGRTALHRRGA